MKLDNFSAFLQNLELSQNLKVVAITGSDTLELKTLLKGAVSEKFETYMLPDDLVKMQDVGLFSSDTPWLVTHFEKLKKKEFALLNSILENTFNKIYLIGSSSAFIENLYALEKNQMLWLDLLAEKVWQKKDRNLQLLQLLCKKEGYSVDKATLELLYNYEDQNLEQALCRLETVKLYHLEDKKINSQSIIELVPKSSRALDFSFIDDLLFKYVPLERPEIYDASELLMFLGQLRYSITASLKVKSLLKKGMSAKEMQSFFPKMSPQALSFQIKKADEHPSRFFEKLRALVFEKELSIKRDFSQPSMIFNELISQIIEIKNDKSR